MNNYLENRKVPIKTPFFYGWVILFFSMFIYFFPDQVKPTPYRSLLITLSKNMTYHVQWSLAFIVAQHYLPV